MIIKKDNIPFLEGYFISKNVYERVEDTLEIKILELK